MAGGHNDRRLGSAGETGTHHTRRLLLVGRPACGTGRDDRAEGALLARMRGGRTAGRPACVTDLSSGDL